MDAANTMTVQDAIRKGPVVVKVKRSANAWTMPCRSWIDASLAGKPSPAFFAAGAASVAPTWERTAIHFGAEVDLLAVLVVVRGLQDDEDVLVAERVVHGFDLAAQ